MDPLFLLTASAAGLGSVAAATGVGLGMRAFGNARLLASIPPTPAGSLEDGLQQVAGVLRAEDGLTAPITGRPCAFYRLLLEQRRRNQWETVLDQREALPATLEDASGSVRVDLTVADVVVASPDRVRTGVFAVPSPELTGLLGRVSAPATPPAGPFLRWREETLAAGDRLSAVGTAKEADGAWVLGEGADAPFVLSDRDEAEVIRHQRRAGRRWVAVAVSGFIVAGWGAWRLLPLMTG